MSHRRPDPRQAGLENVLRNALRLAADSVEPAADGLDRIRTKISTRQPVQASWTSSTPAGVLGSAWRWLEPAVIWLRYVAGAVVERFRPDPDRAGRLGWLRPAAALATVVFIVAAASWAVTALPAVIAPANNTGPFGSGGGSGSSAPAPAHSGGALDTSGTGGIGPAPRSSPGSSRSCRPGSAAPSSSASSSPTGSSSPSPSRSSSPSTSPSPSPSPTDTGSGTPSPSDSPSTSAPTTSPGASTASAAVTGSRAPSAPSSPGSRTRSRLKTSSGKASSPAPPASSKRCGG